MVWPKMQLNHPDKLWIGTGKRLRAQHESILIAVRGAVPQRCRFLWCLTLQTMYSGVRSAVWPSAWRTTRHSRAIGTNRRDRRIRPTIPSSETSPSRH
jgi:hypothetical protein